MTNPGPRDHTPRAGADNALTRARLAAGMTQAELSRMVGLSQVMVCVIERRGWCWEWDAGEIEKVLGAGHPPIFDWETPGEFPQTWVRP
jgi:hypothetical protein